MRRCLRVLTAAAVASFLAAAAIPTAAAASGEKLFLWELQSDTTTVYLLGSIHLATEDFYPLDPAIESAFANSSVLVMEVNMVQMDQGEIQKKFFENGQLPEGKALPDVISPPTLEQLSGFLEERGIPVQSFSMWQPWLISFTLSATELLRLGFDPKFGLDMHFLNQAVQQQKGVMGLETGESQIQLFAGLSPELQEMFLQKTLQELKKLPELVDRIVDAWKTGDAEAMADLLMDPEDLEGGLKPFYDRMFFERNIAMAEKIRGFLASNDRYFVVVGSGHVVGKDGVLDLLGKTENPGYRIRQVPAAAVPAAAAR